MSALWSEGPWADIAKGWGWFYLSTILDDFSRYIVAWKLCTSMTAEDVTDTLEMALATAVLDQGRR